MSDTNNTTHPFVAAAKAKLRFEAGRGYATIEDLWDLPLKKLDEMAVAILDTLEGSRRSFLENPDNRQNIAQKEQSLRLEVLKVVIAVKETENKAKRDAATKKAEIEFLDKLLEKKKLDQLESMDITEIEARLRAVRGEEGPPEPADESATAVS